MVARCTIDCLTVVWEIMTIAWLHDESKQVSDRNREPGMR